MSEPSPKRLKADEGDVALLRAQAAEGEGPGLAQTATVLNNAGEGEEQWVVDLEDCQKALDKVNDEASDRVLAVEREYNKKRRPIYAQRSEIIKQVPAFWQRTLNSHPTLADHLTDDDTAVLEYMTELDVVDAEDIKSGFKIVLTFSPQNPYFSNPTLTKSFHYGDEEKVTIHAEKIDWKEGFAPATGLVGELGPSYMFFDWMATPAIVGNGTPDLIAEALKEEVWPNPLKYYFNEVEEEEEVLEPGFEDLGDEGALLEGEEFEGVLAGGEEDVGEEEDGEGDEGLGEGEAVAYGEDGEDVGLEGEEDYQENGDYS